MMPAVSDAILLPDPEDNVVGDGRRLSQKGFELGGPFDGRVHFFRKTEHRGIHVLEFEALILPGRRASVESLS